jgi:hypothetical protein
MSKKTDRDNSDIYDEAYAAAKNAVDEYRKAYGEPMYCGFAWVVVEPGNCGFAKWLKANEKGRQGYPKGVHVWGPGAERTQSMDLKEVGARAFSLVLQKHGIRAYSDSRAD